MNTMDIVIGDNLFKQPPQIAKDGKYFTKGRNKQIVAYDYDTTKFSSKLLNTREFRLKTGIISCVAKHIIDGDYKGYVEFSINELWLACGGQSRLKHPDKFEAEVMQLLKKLNTVTCNFSNMKKYDKAKKVLESIDDERLQRDLNTLFDCMYTNPIAKAPYLQASLRSYTSVKNRKSKSIHVEGIPVEVGYMILTKTLRTINGDEYLKPLKDKKVKLIDKIYLIALFEALRIKHDDQNRSRSHPGKNSNEILTSHIYQLVDANNKQLQRTARQAIKAILDCYQEIGKIGKWNWVEKNNDKHYKVVIDPPKNH